MFKIFKILENDYRKYLYLFSISFLILAIFEFFNLNLIILIIFNFINEGEIFKNLPINLLEYLNNFKESEIIFLFIVFFIFKNFIDIIFTYWRSKVCFSIREDVSNNLYSYYLNRDYLEHLETNTGTLIRNISAIRSVGFYFLYYSEVIAQIFLTLSVIFFLCFLLGFKVLYLVIIYFILGIVIHYPISKKIKKISTQETDVDKKIISIFTDSFLSLKFIKISNKANKFIENFKNLNFKLKQYGYRGFYYPVIYKNLLEIAILLLLMFVIGIKGFGSDLLLFVSSSLIASYRIIPATMKIAGLFQRLNSIYGQINIGIEEYEKIKKNFFTYNYYQNIKYEILGFDEKINIKDLSFSYKEKKVLDKINLNIKKNKITGIFGESGQGKSTLINIIAGLLNYEGDIELDGKITLNKNQKINLGYVSQNLNIFDGSILDNVTLFESKNIEYDKINLIIKSLNLEKYLKSLPEGLETKLGEFGSKISGGQAQRIAIARSLYQKTDILIFDEPTSMLDEENINSFIKLINVLKVQQAVLIVTHNKKIIDICDEKYFLENMKCLKK